MPRRPESRPDSAIFSPSPSSPRSRSADTRTLSRQQRGRGGAGQPHLLLRRVGREPLGVRRHEEAGDARGRRRRTSRHHLVEVGVAAVGDPGLRAGEDVLVAVAHGLRRHRGRVGPGLRLGQRSRHRAAPRSACPAASASSAPRCPACRGRSTTAQCTLTPTPTEARPRRSPRGPGGRPRTAAPHRRTPRGRAATAAPPGRGCGTPPRGNCSSASAEATLGASSFVARSRVSCSRSPASSVGITRVAGIPRS